MTPNYSDYKRMREQMPEGTYVVVKPNTEYPSIVGMVGVVATIQKTCAGVDFQCRYAGNCQFHSLSGLLSEETGWYVPLDFLAPYEDESTPTLAPTCLEGFLS